MRTCWLNQNVSILFTAIYDFIGTDIYAIYKVNPLHFESGTDHSFVNGRKKLSINVNIIKIWKIFERIYT